MRAELKQFIEQNIDLIEKCKFITLYNKAYNEIPFQVGNLTMNLIEAGIEPIKYMQAIPMLMYGYSGLEKLDIPDNIITIGPYAFDGAYDLKEVNLPKFILSVDDKAFSHCYSLKTITYEGTLQELLDIRPDWDTCLEDTDVTTIECSDLVYLIRK